MKNLLIVFFLLLSITAFSQFRMVGTATWSTLNDSTYQGTVSFQSDLTGMGYLATHIVDTFRLFTPVEKIYRIDSVWNKTFSSATLRIVEMLGTQGVPVGQVMVFNPDGRNTIPQNPFGSTGATAQLNAAVDTWNARQISTSNIVNNGKCLERQHTQVGHTFSIGDAVFWDADTLKLATVNSLLPAQAVVTGFVPDSDILIIAYTGECETTLTHGFTQDSAYYVSRTGGQPVIEGSKSDTSQYLFRALNDSTIVVAIGNMYLEGLPDGNVATSTYKYCSTGTSCLSDSTYTQIYSTVDTVLLGTPTYNGELRCFDNQTVGSVVLKPENVATTEIAGDAVYSLPSGQSICFYASPNGPATWNWYIVSEGNVPATPGIDSSVVRNDSVFLATTGGELFTGVSRTGTNLGNIFFIAETGNNSTGLKGDLNLPFLPSIITTSGPNDFIRFFEGTHTVNVPSSSFPPFRGANISSEWRIDGNLNFNNPAPSPSVLLYSYPLNYTKKLFYEGDQITVNNCSFLRYEPTNNLPATIKLKDFTCTGIGNDPLTIQTQKINVSIDNYNVVADTAHLWQGPWFQVGETNNGELNFDIKNLNRLNARSFLSSHLGLLGFSGTKTFNHLLNINIGNFRNINSGCIFGTSSTFTHLADSVIVNLKVANLFNDSNVSVSDTDPEITYPQWIQAGTNNGDFRSLIDFTVSSQGFNQSYFNLNFKNIDSDLPFKIGGVGTNTVVRLEIDNAIFSKTRAIQISNSGLNNTTYIIDFKNVTCTNSHCISILSTNAKNHTVIIKGKIKTTAAGKPVIFSNQNLVLQDLVMINDGTVPAISATTPINVFCTNVSTNTLLSDSDVTELIQPITRNSNVK